MRLVLLLVVLAACDRRTVTITTHDPDISVNVQTDDDTHAAAIKISFDRSRQIVPLLIVPVPVPYASYSMKGFTVVPSCGNVLQSSSVILEKP